MAIVRNPAVLTSSERLYLDHAATTPVLPQAREAIAQALEGWANPSSPHAQGRLARAALEKARRTIVEELGWRHELIFTSGGSEAVQIAAGRAKVQRRIVGPTEHDAVAAAFGPEAVVLKADGNGLVDLADLDVALSGGPSLVAVQAVNSETGVIQPLDAICELVRSARSLLLADCAQSAGKFPLPDGDFVAIASQKFGGPPGVGALLVKDLSTLEPSGGQERGYRRGTENLPGAAGMAAALASQAFKEAMPRLKALRHALDAGIVENGGIIIAGDAPRIPTIGAYAMPGVASATQLVQLDLAGISVSAGSACSSGSLKPSRVLYEMGLDAQTSASVIRVSFGITTEQSDIARFLTQWRRIKTRSKAEAA